MDKLAQAVSLGSLLRNRTGSTNNYYFPATIDTDSIHSFGSRLRIFPDHALSAKICSNFGFSKKTVEYEAHLDDLTT